MCIYNYIPATGVPAAQASSATQYPSMSWGAFIAVDCTRPYIGRRVQQ